MIEQIVIEEWSLYVMSDRYGQFVIVAVESLYHDMCRCRDLMMCVDAEML